MTLATVLVALRLYIRWKTHANSWDDYLIYLALVSAFIPRAVGSHAPCALSLNWLQPMSFCCSIFDTQRVRYGFGRHMEYVQSTSTEAAMYDILEELFNVLTTLGIKVSICLLVRRIMRGTHRKVRGVLWAMIVFLMAITLTTCVAFGIECRPFRKSWDPEVPGTCSYILNLGLLMRILCGESPCDLGYII